MKVVVVIPALNEEDTIVELIKRIPNFCTILVIDDGSKDKTKELSEKAGAIVYSHKENKGLGNVFKTGIQKALDHNADIIVTIDADGQMFPEDIIKLIYPIVKKKADVVITNRFFFKHLQPNMSKRKRMGNRISTYVVNLLTGKKFGDSTCGFRAYSKEAAFYINTLENYTYVQEVLLDMVHKGFVITECPLYVLGARQGESRLIRSLFNYAWRAGLMTLRTIRDFKPLKFFGIPGILILVGGISLSSYMVIRKIRGYPFMDHPWLMLLSVLFMMIGSMVLLLALITDMVGRLRKVQEEVLYWVKKNGRKNPN